MSAISKQVLNGGDMHSHILLFVNDPAVPCVSKAFQNADRKKENYFMTFLDRSVVQKMEDGEEVTESENLSLDGVRQRVSALRDRIPPLIDDNTVDISKRLDLALFCVRMFSLPALQQNAEHSAAMRVDRFVETLEVEIQEHQKLNADASADRSACVENIVARMRLFVTREFLDTRVREAMAPKDLTGAVRLRAIRVGQEADARQTFDEGEEFAARAYSPFSVAYYQKSEEIAQRALGEKDVALVAFAQILRQGNLVNFGANPPRNPLAIRAWLRHPDNADALGRVKTLELRGLRVLPDEIDVFRNLSKLTVHGENRNRLRTLPDSLANLSLTKLDLPDHNITEIPPVIGRISGLYDCSLQGNLFPIRTLPEAVADPFFLSYESFVLEPIATAASALRCLCFEIPGFPYANRYNANLPREDFTLVPYSWQFRENFTIPNIPFVIALIPLILPLLAGIGLYFTAEGLDRDVGGVLGCIVSLPVFLVAFALIVATGLAGIAVAAPIIGINMFIHWFVGPCIVFPIREHCFGLPRMVDVSVPLSDAPPLA